MDCVPAGWDVEDAEDALCAVPDPDPDIQGLFWAEVGLPDCQGWAWGLAEEDVEEEGAFVLKEKLLLEEPARNMKNKVIYLR